MNVGRNSTKMVKITENEYNMLIQARNQLMHKGYQNIPPEVLRKLNIENFSRGAIVGLGVALLVYYLNKHGGE
ncbi:MAG: hypothetical protein Q7S21_00375 [archaeon]|nr:hypothetical protein [archaeon]